MSRYFCAECLKCRHTAAEKLIILMPLCSTVLAAQLTHNYFAIDGYNWWYIILFPAMIALICGMVSNKDRKMQNKAIQVLPVNLGNVWDGKVLYGVCAAGLSLIVLLVLILGGGALIKSVLHMTFITEPSVKMQLAAVLVLWISSLWQVPFCLALEQKAGFLPMVLVHMGTYILAAVAASLKSFYLLFPGAIAARMMCAVLKVLPNGLPAAEGMMTYSPELTDMRSVLFGIPAAVFWFLLFWFVGRVWFERQVDR